MENFKKKIMQTAVMLICSVFVFSAFMIFSAPFSSAADLNLKITAELNGYDTDFYAVTDSNANVNYDGYDMGSQPLQTNDSRLFSWCNISNSNSTSWPNCTLVIDSWPASSRVFYLVYRFNPSGSGILNLTWDSSSFGNNFNAFLTDYGTNSTYSAGANASLPINMKTTDSYSASFANWRYLTMDVTYTPPGTTQPSNGGTTTTAPPEVCAPNFQYSDWSACDSSKKQTRTYEDKKNCPGSAASRTETRSCCVNDGDCSKKCNTGSCESNQCAYTPSNNGASCGDADACSIGGRCDEGACSPVEQKDCLYGCDLNTGCKSVPLLVPEAIPPEILALAGQGAAGAGCTVDINQVKCGDWGACEGQYDISSLMNGAGGEVKGVQTRKCTDSSRCLPDYTESANCSLKQDVTVNAETTWCGEKYTELIDAKGKVVARMKKTPDGSSIAVDLNAAGVGYCAYCYDGAKDGDEEGIDCGGSCDKCGVSTESYHGSLYNFAELATSLGLFLFFTSSLIFLLGDFALYIRNIFVLKKLGRKLSYWKKEGYDVDVLEKDVHKAEKAFEYKIHRHKKTGKK